MAIEFNNRAWETINGKAPRGFGYWGFQIESFGADIRLNEVWHSGTFAEAKRECMKAIRRAVPAGAVGHIEVILMT